jgi:hypothetical protein
MRLPGGRHSDEQRPVIHREFRIIRRISREDLKDRAQDSLIEGSISPTEIVMKNTNTLSSKLIAFAAALAMNGLVLGGVGYLFALQSHPNISAIAFAKAVVASSPSVEPFGLLPSLDIGELEA